MLYSIIPVNLNDYYDNSFEIKNMVYKGTLVEYYQDVNGNKIVNRVLSTSLQSYLNNDYTPGSVIKD